MGLLMRPRRPLARLAVGAAVGGAASRAGKRHARQDVYNQPASPAYDAAQAAPVPAAPVPAAAPVDETGELERLAKLHDSGALTDAEFAAAKARVLGV
jgi:Short C-terminal domain